MPSAASNWQQQTKSPRNWGDFSVYKQEQPGTGCSLGDCLVPGLIHIYLLQGLHATIPVAAPGGADGGDGGVGFHALPVVVHPEQESDARGDHLLGGSLDNVGLPEHGILYKRSGNCCTVRA